MAATGVAHDAPRAPRGTPPAALQRGDAGRGEDAFEGARLPRDRKLAPPSRVDGRDQRDEQQDERRDERPSDPGDETCRDPASSEEETGDGRAPRPDVGEEVAALRAEVQHYRLRTGDLEVLQGAVCDENAALRAEVRHYKLRTGAALRRQKELQARCSTAEQQLARATETLHKLKADRVRWMDEQAELEVARMNETCAAVAETETRLMGEIVKRDVRIVELTALWSEEARQRTVLAREMDLGRFI